MIGKKRGAGSLADSKLEEERLIFTEKIKEGGHKDLRRIKKK